MTNLVEIKSPNEQVDKPASKAVELQEKHAKMQEAIKLFNEKARFMNTKDVILKAWQKLINESVAGINADLMNNVDGAIKKIDAFLAEFNSAQTGEGVAFNGKKIASLRDFLEAKDTSSEYQSLQFKPEGDFAYITLGPDFYGQCPTVSNEACIYQYQWCTEPQGGFRFPLFLQPGTSAEFVMNDTNGKRHVMRFSRDAQGNYTKEDGLNVNDLKSADDLISKTAQKERAKQLQDDIYKGIDDSINEPIKQGAERNKERIAKIQNLYKSVEYAATGGNIILNNTLELLNQAIKGMNYEQLKLIGIDCTKDITFLSDSNQVISFKEGKFKVVDSEKAVKMKERIGKASEKYGQLKSMIDNLSPIIDINMSLQSLNELIKGMSEEQLKSVGILTQDLSFAGDPLMALIYEKGQFTIGASKEKKLLNLDQRKEDFTNFINKTVIPSRDKALCKNPSSSDISLYKSLVNDAIIGRNNILKTDQSILMFEQLNAEIKELEDYFLNPKNIQNLFQKAASQTGGVKRKL